MTEAVLVILTVLISCFAAIGFYVVTRFNGHEDFDEMTYDQKKHYPNPSGKYILWWFRYYVGRFIPHFYTKPVYSCLPCMGSLHSLVPTLIFLDILWWPLTALVTCGVNYYLSDKLPD